MFETIADYLGRVFKNITDKGSLTQRDIDEALNDVEKALIEADVNRQVVGQMMALVREKALGQDLLKSVTPAQQVIKAVYDEMLVLLSGEPSDPKGPKKKKELKEMLFRPNAGPAIYLFVGLQGSGKTTTLAKLAYHLIREKKRVLTASMDVYRPAAQEQLAILSKRAGADSLEIIPDQNKPPLILKRALNDAKLKGYDFLLLDTAGRLHIDERLLAELVQIYKFSKPHETVLVLDSLTGQVAADVALSFKAKIPLSGFALTRLDGDGRGGAALSIRAMTDVPIKLLGVGEKLEDLEVFQAERIAGRILGMGDIIDLVSKVQETIQADEADRMTKRLQKGQFDLNDMLNQLRHMKSMGGLKSLMGMLPGFSKKKDDFGDVANLMDEKVVDRQMAIIFSMTNQERTEPEILDAKRRRRIASGAGVDITEVNKLMKMFKQISDLYKKMSRTSGGTMNGMMNFFKSMSNNPMELFGMPKISVPESTDEENVDPVQRMLKDMGPAVNKKAIKDLFLRRKGENPSDKEGNAFGPFSSYQPKGSDPEKHE